MNVDPFTPSQQATFDAGMATLSVSHPGVVTSIQQQQQSGDLNVGELFTGATTTVDPVTGQDILTDSSGLVGAADNNTIGVVTGEGASVSQVAARILHEYRHVEGGGPLDQCTHSEVYAETFYYLAEASCVSTGACNACEALQVSCADLQNVLDKQAQYQAGCEILIDLGVYPPGSGEPVGDIDESCCSQ